MAKAVERVAGFVGRLPTWLQVALFPCVLQAGVIAAFPALMAILCALAAALLVYLKTYFLGEQLTWGQIGVMATSPLWLYALLGTVFVVWVAVGTTPWAVVVYSRQLWEGRPLRFKDPEPDIPEGARSAVATRSREGKGLTADDIRVILVGHEAIGRRCTRLLAITGACPALACLGLVAARLLGGFYSERVNALAGLFCVSTLSPILFLHDPIDAAGRLRCRHCGRRLHSLALKRALDADACLHCSGPGPLLAKPPAAPGSRLWDAEVP